MMQVQSAGDGSEVGSTSLRKSDLSGNQRRLVELMQDVNHGRIEGLIIRGREPIWSPPPRVLRDRVIGKRSGPRPERQQTNFALKDPVCELLDELRSAPDGAKFTIVLQEGLPTKLTREDPIRN